MTTVPRVSVVMSVFNDEAYLAEAVESVLGQTFTDFEFLIVNDGSSDGSANILQDFAAKDDRVRIIEQDNQGLTKALNRGLAEATGEFIARMDGDDVCELERFEKQIYFLDENPQIVALGTSAIYVDEDGNKMFKREVPLCHEDIEQAHFLSKGGYIIHPTAMIRRSSILQIGGYREEFRYAQDYDLWLRLAENGLLQNLEEALLKYRVSRHAITAKKSRQQQDCVRRIFESTLRRRKVTVEKILKHSTKSRFGNHGMPFNPMNLKAVVKHARKYGSKRAGWCAGLELIREGDASPKIVVQTLRNLSPFLFRKW